jgi:hypothetical protein
VRSVTHRKVHGSNPNIVGKTFTPPRGCSIQRQIVPVTMNESAIGKRKSVRKNPSPSTSRSSRKARKSPRPIHPARKKMVKKKVLTRSCRNRTSMRPVKRSR